MAENNVSNQDADARNRRKERIGEVLSTKMQKTIVVRVQRHYVHRRFRKVVKSYKHYYAHDEEGRAKAGDWVRIMETRPYSKLKRWRLEKVLSEKEAAASAAA